MIVTVNGEDRTLADGATVRALVTELDLPDEGVAIAVDGVVVPSSG
ncbi:sulfur carrier protein ThiS, partial [Dietzia sp. Die43]